MDHYPLDGFMEVHHMYSFIVYIIIALSAYFIVEKIARRWWNIPYNRESGLEGLGTTHTWVMRIGWTLFFICVVFFQTELVGGSLSYSRDSMPLCNGEGIKLKESTSLDS
jgi:hypothetical protein